MKNSKKILLIEDDTVMRENTAEILELANYHVTTAVDGREGTTLAKECKPDLIICDIMMPKLDGYGVLHILSKDPETACIPFIFLTAKAEKSEMRRGMELGADDYLTKPFEDTELLNAVEARLTKSSVMKREFAKNAEGIEEFFHQARGIKDLDKLSQQRQVVQYKKKHVIYNEGDRPQYLYFLNSGKIKIFKTHDDGKEYVTNVYKPGEFFGIHSLFEERPYSDTAITLENSEICKIPKSDFLALIYNNRDVASQFIKLLSNDVEEKEKQLLGLAYDTVRKRAAQVLVQLEKRYQVSGEDETRIRMTREDLAAMAGTATETMIRCLSEFKTDHMIEIKGRDIIILDTEGLANIPY